MRDHFRHLLLFRTLVDAGTLTAAAEQLNLSKSVLSQHLKSQERLLYGVSLYGGALSGASLREALPGFYSPEVNVYAIHPYQPLPRLVQQAIQEVESTLQQLCGGDV